MENKFLKLINKLENILIKDKRFKHDATFKSKIININEDTETENKEPINITALFNLAKLSDGSATNYSKDTVYNYNFDLTEDINNFKQININLGNLSKILGLFVPR